LEMVTRMCLWDMLTRRRLWGDAHAGVLLKEVLVRRCSQGGACEEMLTRCSQGGACEEMRARRYIYKHIHTHTHTTHTHTHTHRHTHTHTLI
jgi:hypothetical protein